jgi:two-component system heavy metal sensor histidine kinase CusS
VSRVSEEYREVLGSTLEECLRLLRMIDSLLFLPRAENPQTEIRREMLDVGRNSRPCGNCTIPLLVKLASNSISPSAAPSLPRLTGRSSSAIGNLIENALAHTNPGGHVRMEAGRDDLWLRLNESQGLKVLGSYREPELSDGE